MIIAFNKPYGILSQFQSDGSSHGTLSIFDFPKHLYPLGRLDADSEGLLLLSDEPALNTRLLLPSNKHDRTYHVQVEGIPDVNDMIKLQSGTLIIQGHQVLPCTAHPFDGSHYPDRNPPIRIRKSIPDSWISLTLHEGKNRQVRKMTAAIGHPTLRLIRFAIGAFSIKDLPIGTWNILNEQERSLIFRK